MLDNLKHVMKSPLGHAGGVGKFLSKGQEGVGLVLRGRELGQRIVEHADRSPKAELKISYR